MTDQIEKPKQEVQPTPTEAVKTGDDRTFTQAEVETLIRERLDRERRKAEEAAKLAQEKAMQEAAAKNGEWQKLAEAAAKKAEELERAIKARDILDLKRTIAKKVGLSEALAARLSGETEEEISLDAKALLELMPKPPEAKPVTPGIVPANPGSAGSTGETDAQRRKRLIG